MTFANQPGILITFLSTGAQLQKVVLLQTEQAISINVHNVKYVRQRLPVVRWPTRQQKLLVICEMGNTVLLPYWPELSREVDFVCVGPVNKLHCFSRDIFLISLL